MSGWIKLHRSIANNWVWSGEKFTRGQAWVDLLLKANFKDVSIQIKGQVVHLKKGQQARSEVTLSSDWGWSRDKVRRFLKTLVSEGMIIQQKTQLTSIITICNYSSFQDDDTADDTAYDTADKTAGNTQDKKVRSKERKNDKNKDLVVISDEMPTERGEGVLGFIPTNKKSEWYKVKSEDVRRWVETYPGVNVKQELANIREWGISNPTKRKTSGGMAKHITNWLSRAQNDRPVNHDRQNQLSIAQGRSHNPGALKMISQDIELSAEDWT